MNVFKERCITLRKKDYTLPEIMRFTGRSKASVYFHVKDIPLSVKKQSEIRQASGERIRPFALARKGRSARPFKSFRVWTPNIVLLLGHLLFDGELSRGSSSYNNRSAALVRRVEQLMQEVYEYEPKQWQNPLTGVYRISYYNVALRIYLQKRTTELFKKINKLPLSLKREFIKAFFDDEGCMDFRPRSNTRKIRGYQKDVRILKVIQKLLKDVGIEARIEMPNEVVIVGKENLMRFRKEINFSQGIYINGNRTNSRWKKHIEKRELLRLAIESFKS